MVKENINNYIGKKFGRLTPIKEIEPYIQPSGKIKRKVTCICDCGNYIEVVLYNLKDGKTKSCGCFQKEQTSKANKTHGEGCIKTKEFCTWNKIIARCYNVKNKSYKNYGGRGIKVCDRWLEKYENFLEDMGRSPTPKHSIDRIDNNGDYSTENCRWATQKEQSNNRRSNRLITYNGETLNVTQWAEKCNISSSLLRQRLNRDKLDFFTAISK